jgi:hypothetical protein
MEDFTQIKQSLDQIVDPIIDEDVEILDELPSDVDERQIQIQMDTYSRDYKESILFQEKKNKLTDQILSCVDLNFATKEQISMIVDSVLRGKRPQVEKCDASTSAELDKDI